MSVQAGKTIVAVKINQDQDDQGRKPSHSGNAASRHVGEPFHEPEGVQLSGHHDQPSKPDEGIPGAFFGQDIFPPDHPGDQHDGNTEDGHHGRIELVPFPVIQSVRMTTKTAIIIFSFRLTGPIFSSSLWANSDAWGVSLISGDTTYRGGRER